MEGGLTRESASLNDAASRPILCIRKPRGIVIGCERLLIASFMFILEMTGGFFKLTVAGCERLPIGSCMFTGCFFNWLWKKC